MKQLSKMELLNLLGGSVQAHSRCDDLVANANKIRMEQLGLKEIGICGQTNLKSIAKTLFNRWRKDPLQPFNYL